MSNFYGYITGCTCEYCNKERAREVADKALAEQAAAETKEAHPTSRLLTLEMVLKGSPCYEYRNRFTERYGESGVEVTVEKALSESNDWDWEWAGAILLSRKAKAEFSRRSREADKAYDEAMQPYYDLYNAAYDRYAYLDIALAAQNAASAIAAPMRRNARITAFAELFILDGPAYVEEHKDDAPFVNPYEYDEYDEDDYNDED